MQIIIISDSHGNIVNLKHVMGFVKKIGAGAVIHCGDWNNIEAVKTVIDHKIPLYSVLGNADINPEVEELLERKCKKFERLFLEFVLGNKKIGVTHNLSRLISSIESLDIIFCGHTHKQMDRMDGMVRVVNPGALERSISFAVYDTDTDKVELINE